MLNHETSKRWDDIVIGILDNKIDLVFITPESLFNKKFEPYISKFNIGMFVIDEAHCISDWGHDFRLLYGKIGRILKILPHNILFSRRRPQQTIA
jgi:ATP-dependent DNA helicase RecQ